MPLGEIVQKAQYSVIPFDAQAARWDYEYWMRHDRLFAVADIVTATGHVYTKACMFRRNRDLIDNADLLLAAFDGQPGGTAMTCEYAWEVGVQIRLIMPLACAA